LASGPKNLCINYKMSSTLRTMATVPKDGKFDNISTLSYEDSAFPDGDGGYYRLPIPFTVVNGVLDIALTNSSVENFVNNGINPIQFEGDSFDDTEYQVKMMGGKRLVTAIGTNFNTYLRKRIQGIDTLGSPYSGELVIVVNPVMTKVQLAQPGQVQGLTFENVYGVNEYPPTSDEYVGGNETNKYFTSWVFYKPLTVRFVSSASATGFKYITFSTHHDGD
jgi:hypothetical protein